MPKIEVASEQVGNWVAKTVLDRKATYRTRDDLIHGLRRQRLLRLRNRPGRAYQRYVGKGIKSAIGYRLIQTVVGAIARQPPKWHVDSPDKELAGQVQRWIPLIFQAVARVSGVTSIFWPFLYRVVADGIAVQKYSRRPWTDMPIPNPGEDVADYNKRVREWVSDEAPIPFRGRLVDGLTFYPPLGEWESDFVIESSKRATGPTLRQLRVRPVNNRLDLLEAVPEGIPYPELELPSLPPTMQVDEIWTPKECLIRIENAHTLIMDNEYGEIPYKWCFGEQSGSDDPALRGVSVMFPLQYIEPWLDQCLTVMAAWTQFAQPTPYTRYQPGPGTNPTGSLTVSEFQVGRLHELGVGGEIGFVQPPEVQNVIEFANVLLNLADRAGMAPVPPWIGTRTPGTALSAAQEAITAKLKPIANNVEVCFADTAKMLARWVQTVIGQPVRVSGLVFEEGGRSTHSEETLLPSQVAKIKDILCEISFQGLQDEIAMGTHASLMKREGLWSKRRAMLKSGVEDPVAEDDQILKEQTLETGAVGHYLVSQTISEEPVLEEAQQQLESVEGEGTAPEGRQPPQPRGRKSGMTRRPGGRRR